MTTPLLRDVASRCIVLCYRENVEKLTDTLRNSGIDPIVQRGSYSPEELKKPAAMRCFMNHRDAWQRAAELDGYTIICEADFVPCRDLGSLPVFWPLDNPKAWGYLYQGAPRVLSLIGPEKYIRAHCSPLVAYVINSDVARLMLNFYDEVTAQHGTDTYYTFDVWLQWAIMGKGGEAYMPARHYGEHGGLPNPEHRGWQTRGGQHRADNLARTLAFLPQYAEGSRFAFRRERLIARALGMARLATGRWIADTSVYPRDLAKTTSMMLLGARRLIA